MMERQAHPKLMLSSRRAAAALRDLEQPRGLCACCRRVCVLRRLATGGAVGGSVLLQRRAGAVGRGAGPRGGRVLLQCGAQLPLELLCCLQIRRAPVCHTVAHHVAHMTWAVSWLCQCCECSVAGGKVEEVTKEVLCVADSSAL